VLHAQFADDEHFRHHVDAERENGHDPEQRDPAWAGPRRVLRDGCGRCGVIGRTHAPIVPYASGSDADTGLVRLIGS
jgi:hypothetical protein